MASSLLIFIGFCLGFLVNLILLTRILPNLVEEMHNYMDLAPEYMERKKEIHEMSQAVRREKISFLEMLLKIKSVVCQKCRGEIVTFLEKEEENH